MIDSRCNTHDADLTAWRTELLRALGGNVDDRLTPFVEGVVVARSVIADLAELALAAKDPAAPVFRQVTTQNVVRMARWLRQLGLTRHDVRDLDLGRRRRAAH